MSWTTDGAKEYASATDTNLCNQDSRTGRVKNAAECTSCLASKGYYLFLDQQSANSAALQTPSGIFTGAFLNAFPPKFIIARKVLKQLARIDTANPNPIDNVRFGLAVLRPKTSGSGSPSNRMSNTDGGQLLVPLGPNCNVYPARPEDMVTARQTLIDAMLACAGPLSASPCTATCGEAVSVGSPLADHLAHLRRVVHAG